MKTLTRTFCRNLARYMEVNGYNSRQMSSKCDGEPSKRSIDYYLAVAAHKIVEPFPNPTLETVSALAIALGLEPWVLLLTEEEGKMAMLAKIFAQQPNVFDTLPGVGAKARPKK